MKSLELRVLINLVIIILLLVCCKKEDIQSEKKPCLPYTQPTHRIKEILIEKNDRSSKISYYYDYLNRLKHLVDSSEFRTEIYYSYSNDRIYMSNQDSAGNDYFYILDSTGHAIRDKMGFEFWEYNSEGYMTKYTSTYPHGSTMISEYSFECYNNDSVATEVIEYPSYKMPKQFILKAYYNNLLNTIGVENTGVDYFGKQNNCLIKTIIFRNSENFDSILAYNYELDSLKRVLKETVLHSGYEISVRRFKYY